MVRGFLIWDGWCAGGCPDQFPGHDRDVWPTAPSENRKVGGSSSLLATALASGGVHTKMIY
jgi:hypothetical protein